MGREAPPLSSAQAELWVVRTALAQVGGNVSEAARLLRTNRNKIYRVMGQEQVDAKMDQLRGGRYRDL